MWLRQGEPVRCPEPWGLTDQAHVEEDGTLLITDVRVDRVFLFAGLFYGIQGMRSAALARCELRHTSPTPPRACRV